MPTTFTIEFRIPDENGTLTDATGPHASGVPTIGIIRTDTSAVVVATGTAMVHDSLGVYSKAVPSPVAGVTYRATWIAIVDGDTITDQFDLTEPQGDADWHYADYDAVEDILGVNNLTIIASPDNGAIDYGLIQRAGEYSDALIDARLGRFGLTVPLAGTDAQTDLLLRDISAKLTIAQLNRSRALVIVSRNNTTQVAGVDKVVGQWEREAWSMLTSLATGIMALTADYANAGPSAPVAAGSKYFALPVYWWPY